VFGSIEMAPEPARAGLVDKIADLFDAAPDRIFFGTDYPAAMGSLQQLHGQVPASRAQQMAANAARFISEAFGLDLERARSPKVRP
jgi:predicted TIM-barrel fold metal-dependent hydrolase